jgi:hypothetical protein|tara:strand:- start:312 stop:413 length:102 start_codon:yes stop_codon:yes gene_type:complete
MKKNGYDKVSERLFFFIDNKPIARAINGVMGKT